MNVTTHGAQSQHYCSHCSKWKQEDQFAWMNKQHGIKQYRCKSCFQEYYQTRTKVHVRKILRKLLCEVTQGEEELILGQRHDR